jgi:hypothetical protein
MPLQPPAMSKLAKHPGQHRAEVRMPTALWRRLHHAAADTNTNASELIRQGARQIAQYVETHKRLPPKV